MNILFIPQTPFLTQQLGATIEEANKKVLLNNDVFWLSCDKSVGKCVGNQQMKSALCYVCNYYEKTGLKYLSKKISIISFSDYLTKSIINKIENLNFSYNSIEDIKRLEWNGINIGLGAYATYITLTRNKSIKFNDNFKIFFNEYLVAEVKLIEVLIQLHFKYHFDKISVFNGRLSQTRPAIEFAIKNKIPYSCLELIAPSMDGIFFPMNFEQSLPHDIAAYDRKVNEYWNFSNLPIIEREKIACDFYEKRKKGIRAGDRVYTENQKIGLLPLQWDETVSNISIFNSSDDEYSSIGGEWDKGNLFSSQIEGIKKIVEHYLEDKNKHFYLRIHPNLSSVKYKYHTDLYKLNYPNLTILKSDSPVSTYSLIDNSKIIIVFGSSVGIEAAYWKKPVVLLTKSMYVYSGCVYYPTNLDSLWALLKTENLPTLFNESVLKYGFFNNYEPKNTKSLLNYDYVNIRLFNHEYQSSSFLKVLNSQKLFIIFRKIYFVFFSIITFGKIKYKTIPSDES